MQSARGGGVAVSSRVALRQPAAPLHRQVGPAEHVAVVRAQRGDEVQVALATERINELTDHLRAEVRQAAMTRFADMERMRAEDIADVVGYIVTRPRRVAINEILIRPSEQEA